MRAQTHTPDARLHVGLHALRGRVKRLTRMRAPQRSACCPSPCPRARLLICCKAHQGHLLSSKPYAQMFCNFQFFSCARSLPFLRRGDRAGCCDARHNCEHADPRGYRRSYRSACRSLWIGALTRLDVQRSDGAELDAAMPALNAGSLGLGLVPSVLSAGSCWSEIRAVFSRLHDCIVLRVVPDPITAKVARSSKSKKRNCAKSQWKLICGIFEVWEYLSACQHNRVQSCRPFIWL